MDSFNPGWYVCYTMPRHEKKVAARLSLGAIDFFLPTVKILSIWRDRKKYVDAPLFPSYIFVYLKKKEDYYHGLGIEGILYYLRSGKKVAQVEEKIINDIRLIVSHDKHVEVCEARFYPGQHVVIKDGPMTGLSCEIVEFQGKKRFLVRLSLLGRNLLVAFPSEQLTAI